MNRRPLWLRALLWLAVAAWAAAIVYFSSLPGPQIEEIMPFEVWDKFLHFAAFTVGGALLASALRASTGWRWKRAAVTAAALLVLFGATDEWHQLYTPNRSGADVWDWLADALGAVAGGALCTLAMRLAGRGRG